MATQTAKKKNQFKIDVPRIRDEARKHMDHGVVTDGNTIAVDRLTEVLNAVNATEIVCYLRYGQHAIAAIGIDRAQVVAELTLVRSPENGRHATDWESRVPAPVVAETSPA